MTLNQRLTRAGWYGFGVTVGAMPCDGWFAPVWGATLALILLGGFWLGVRLAGLHSAKVRP